MFKLEQDAVIVMKDNRTKILTGKGKFADVSKLTRKQHIRYFSSEKEAKAVANSSNWGSVTNYSYTDIFGYKHQYEHYLKDGIEYVKVKLLIEEI